MSKNKTPYPTIKEDEDFLAFLCGEDVKFPYFKYQVQVDLPDQELLRTPLFTKRFI